jgi:hypothetical protein
MQLMLICANKHVQKKKKNIQTSTMTHPMYVAALGVSRDCQLVPTTCTSTVGGNAGPGLAHCIWQAGHKHKRLGGIFDQMYDMQA